LLIQETKMHTTRQLATLTAAFLVVLMMAAPALAGDYRVPYDKKAFRSLKVKLATGVAFTDLADFEKAQLVRAAERRTPGRNNAEAVFEEACSIYMESRYGSKMKRFRNSMNQRYDNSDMLADVEARNAIAAIIGLDYQEAAPSAAF
jgi:hypothetical protein